MFAEASSRLRTQAGTHCPAMTRTLSNLLNLSLNPDTDMNQLIAAAEMDAVILAEFLKLESPNKLANWHKPFNRTHFMCVAAQLATIQVSITEESWKSANELGRFALICHHIAGALARIAEAPDINEAKLTSLLASMGDTSLNYLPLNPRDAIRFQYAPADALQNTDLLIRIVATANQLVQHSDIPIRDNYLSDWGFPESSAKQVFDEAMIFADEQLNNLAPANDYKMEMANLSEALRNFQRKTLLDLQLGVTDNLSQEIQRLGISLFGLNSCQFFERTSEGFVNDDLLITSEKSIAKKAADSESVISSADTSMIVVDQQMMERSNSSILIAIPVVRDCEVTGILIAGTDIYHPDSDVQGLTIFAASVAEATFISPQRNQVSVDSVQRKAREITHEVNNPFSIIQNYLKILTLKLGEEHEAQKAINTITSEIQRAALILKRYNTIGEEDTQSQEVADCHEVVTALIEVFRNSYPSVKFDVDLQSDNPHITLSGEQLKQVLVNLVKNAIEAMGSNGEIKVHTTDITFPTTNYLELEISDSGPGIAVTMRDDLFVSGTTSKDDKSDEESGLGLGIVNDIISTNSGMISFQTGDSGTCFRILLPQSDTSLDTPHKGTL